MATETVQEVPAVAGAADDGPPVSARALRIREQAVHHPHDQQRRPEGEEKRELELPEQR